MSEYGRAREGQRASREAARDALVSAEASLRALRKADTLVGHASLVAAMEEVVAQIKVAKHEEIGGRW